MEQYEKIRPVGKGAFGVAVLCRKIKTNQLVVLKEINTDDLSPTEKQLAQNEVEVLSVLNHPNIISYGGSFQNQGNLVIEMEYADGGTLAQMLANRETHFPERQILSLIQQITSAIRHMHEHKILHRDLKTANVFMTADGLVKIGDFGISKILTTNVQAQTVLGTPYYLSPEMCEGKNYDEKSDIWALGCILYEMCSLHKTFQASTLPALVNKIMKAQYSPIPEGYSEKLNALSKELLNKDPKKRPAADDVLEKRIPEILASLKGRGHTYVETHLSFSTGNKNNGKNTEGTKRRSVLYEVKSFENNIDMKPVGLPPKAEIRHLAVGRDHYIAISKDNVVFTWGNGIKGQLGCGGVDICRQNPAIVSELLGKNIIMASAGDAFSIFLSAQGLLYSCGDGSLGSLGQGNWDDSFDPHLIESLLSLKIVCIASGATHSVAMTESGQIYSWGGGGKGQIGHSTTHDINLPTLVILPLGVQIKSIHCGGDSTILITTGGKLLACGCNKFNKLALTGTSINYNLPHQHFVSNLTEIKTIPGAVINCCVGVQHCCFYVKLLNNKTAVYSSGHPFHNTNEIVANNADNTKYLPNRIQELDGVEIKMLSCGPTYSIVGTDDNCILLWGTRYGVKNLHSSVTNSQESSGVWSQQSFVKRELNETWTNESENTFDNMKINVYVPEIITKPISVLALYSSPSQINSGHVVLLAGLFPLAHKILVLIDTTTVLIKDKELKNSDDIELQDCDSMGPIPNWIQAEVDQSQYSWSN